MTYEEILSFLDGMPATAEERMAYVHARISQVFGWIAFPDKFWLCEFLPDLRKEFDHRMHILEIGTFNGGSSRGLIALTGGSLSGIDNWVDVADGAQAFWETLRYPPDLSAHVKNLISDNSREVGQHWNEPIDLLFIDAAHSYDDAISDMRLFCPHVTQGGYCLVDDMEMGDVRQAVGEYFYNGEWEIIREPDISTTAKIFCARRK